MRARIWWSVGLYAVGWFWNCFLFRYGGFYGDWLVLGRWAVCLGDVAYLLCFSVLLSIPMRRSDGNRVLRLQRMR